MNKHDRIEKGKSETNKEVKIVWIINLGADTARLRHAGKAFLMVSEI